MTQTMVEIRFHGRGGQGTVVASVLLAKAMFKAGHHVQSFPVFGVERRGAPVEAYLRIAPEKIYLRSNVVAPDHVLVQDRQLLQMLDVTRGLKPGGWILINTAQPPQPGGSWADFKVAIVDGTRIAIKHQLGTRTHPLINTAMLGALARILAMPPLEMLTEVIASEISSATAANIAAARDGYQRVHVAQGAMIASLQTAG
jgi:pyruvate ferredoxin oxidoreductase gamma subunit/2-oxoisovalerate ferredoxin oxidoreductase gamma subunit